MLHGTWADAPHHANRAGTELSFRVTSTFHHEAVTLLFLSSRRQEQAFRSFLYNYEINNEEKAPGAGSYDKLTLVL